MRQRLVVSILSLLCVVFLGLCGMIYLRTDRTGPEITAGEAISTHKENSSSSVLLNGVTAYDQRDGDVSDTLIVERTTIAEDGQSAVVVYAAKDKSNNVTKKEITVTYVQDDSSSKTQDTAESSLETDDNEETGTSDIYGSGETSADEDDLMINTDTTPLNSTGVPVIRLKQYKVIINAGDAFEPLTYVESAVDDKDYASTRIQIEGEYDRYTAGTYELKFYVTDSDGNQSNIEVLTLEVR